MDYNREEEWLRNREKEEKMRKRFGFICLIVYQLFKGYLMPKFDLFLNAWM